MAPTADEPAVRCLVHLVEVGAGVEQVGAPWTGPHARGAQRVGHGHQRGGTVDHGGVDDLSLPRPLGADDGGQHAEGQQHAAAAEVPDQVERRQRALAGPSDRLERTGQRDVVDVVSGGLGHRALLAPTGHPAEDEPRVAGQTVVRPETEPLGHPGSESLHEPVGRLHQSEDERHPVGVLEIDRHRPASRFIRSTCGSWRGGYVARSKRSIRTMSAPASASIIPANGAGPSPASSTMRTPSSGPLTGHPPMTGRGGTGPARSGMGFRGRSWPDGGRRGPRGSNAHAAPRRPGAYLRATGRGPGSGSREHATEVVGLGPRTGRTAPVASPRSVRIADQPPLQPPRGADWCHRSDEPQDPDG